MTVCGMFSPFQEPGIAPQRLGAELRSHDGTMLDQIPTEVTNHYKAPTDGVGSSDMLGAETTGPLLQATRLALCPRS